MRRVAVVGAGMTPFGAPFALGIKHLLPKAFADCAASVDKGLSKTDLQAASFGAMGTTDGFPSDILTDSLGLSNLPVTRIENSCATGNDAVRNANYSAWRRQPHLHESPDGADRCGARGQAGVQHGGNDPVRCGRGRKFTISSRATN